jgi:uncharacterized RDD family membrane protein YckC
MSTEPIAQSEPPLRERYVQAWARWLARSVDALLILGVAFGVWYGIGVYWGLGVEFGLTHSENLDWLLTPSVQTVLVETFVFVVLMLIVEPFFIGIAGATPGKWLLGIRVTRADGRNLGYGGAFMRTLLVIALGLGFYVPFLSFLTMVVQFAIVQNGKPATWDEILGSKVEHRVRPSLVWLATLASVIGVRIAMQWDRISERFG